MTFRLEIPLNPDATNQINDLVRALRLVADEMQARHALSVNDAALVLEDKDRWKWNDESLVAQFEVTA